MVAFGPRVLMRARSLMFSGSTMIFSTVGRAVLMQFWRLSRSRLIPSMFVLCRMHFSQVDFHVFPEDKLEEAVIVNIAHGRVP
jgi:hypothetical protein